METREDGLLRTYGDVQITDEGPTDIVRPQRPSLTVETRRYRWVPPLDIETETPPGLTIEFKVFAAADGRRRFVPTSGGEELVEQAFVAGLALRIRDGKLDREHRQSYRIMKLIYSRVRKMQEHRDREFRHSRDLFVRPSGRGGGIDKSILPKDLGLNEKGEGRRWSVSQLTREGRERARIDGIEPTTSDVAIQYGLLAAAERNPFFPAEKEIPSLVQMALFDFDRTETKREEERGELLERVESRYLELLNDHLDEPFADFDAWYNGPKSNLFKSLAKCAGYPDGKLDLNVVRGAFLLLGWRAYEYVADCVDYFVQAFMKSLPKPKRMSAEERQLFSQMYQRQAYLGGLPLVMILERSRLIGPPIQALWNNPTDGQLIGVLHRLLCYYAEMSTTRRQADRQFKKRSHGRKRPVRELTNQRREDAPQVPIDLNLKDLHCLEDLHAVIRSVLRRRGIGCAKCNAPLESKILSTDKKWRASGTIEVSCWCPEHEGRRKETLTLEELRSAAEGEVADGG
jgi:hypothetical protein